MQKDKGRERCLFKPAQAPSHLLGVTGRSAAECFDLGRFGCFSPEKKKYPEMSKFALLEK